MKPWKQYSYHELHKLLIAKTISKEYRTVDYVVNQALMCPYYVPLDSKMGSDWGVIVNPESSRFGTLIFEHDECGCPLVRQADGSTSEYKHIGAISQEGDTWDIEWQHRCTAGWCDDPCEIKAISDI